MSSPNKKRHRYGQYWDDDNRRKKQYQNADYTEQYAERNTLSLHSRNFSSDDYKRSIVIGNLHQACTNDLLSSFLYNVLRAVKILHHDCNNQNEGPFACIDIRANSADESVVCFRDLRDTLATLRLNNIPFMGSLLRIERHWKWNGPEHQRKAKCDWNQKLGQVNIVKKKEACYNSDPQNRILVVKSFLPLNHALIPLFVGSAMEQLGLIERGKILITDFRKKHDRNMGYLTFQTATDAQNAFLLQNLPLLDTSIYFERPYCYKGDSSLDKHQDWSKSIYNFFYGRKVHDIEASDESASMKNESTQTDSTVQCDVEWSKKVKHSEGAQLDKPVSNEKLERLVTLEATTQDKGQED